MLVSFCGKGAEGMTWQERYQAWRDAEGLDEATRGEIAAMDEKVAEDSFYRDLAFGTGGLRGELGAGTNRMNVYTVRRATQGLANYMVKTGQAMRVAIAHDSRIGSEEFARAAAEVLAASGIAALPYLRLEPTPALSFAVRDQACGMGICITASHNPAKYNGYKVYGADGCQITLEAAEAIQAEIDAVDALSGVKRMPFEEGVKAGLIRPLGEDVLDRFLEAVLARSLRDVRDVPLSVVYTPLNGTGRECVTRMLDACNIRDVHVVPEQEFPDGHFPTCPFPNPEIREALALGLRDCARLHPDLLLATDPDCDRVGIAVRDGADYTLLTGNEVGVLLLQYICEARLDTGRMPARPVAVTTIVSGLLADRVAEKYGVELRRTLTGFKFIGETIGRLEKAGEADRYIFGFEESYGYLSGGHVRDKDAVNASLLICEMARWYKRQGKTLRGVLDELYREYGPYDNGLYSFTFEGAEGMADMGRIMSRLRAHTPDVLGGLPVLSVRDYLSSGTGLPSADVLEYNLSGHCKLMIRPSGTEPKLKAYTFTSRKDIEDRILAWLKEQMK